MTNPRVFRMLGIPLGAAVSPSSCSADRCEIDEAWADLAGWQRGVIGLLVVAIEIAVIMVVAGVAITLGA